MHLRAQQLIRDIPDFPKPGIIFKDITPVLLNAGAFQEVIDRMVEWAASRVPDRIAAIESRGFLFGAPVACALGIGLIPIRKSGKLPFRTIKREYTLEYGNAAMELHEDALQPHQRILLIDDVLATGGTAETATHLVEALGGTVCGVCVLAELAALAGRARLGGCDVHSLICY